ncbi:hypothetical protein SEA_FEDE_26 [Microbacterium phage Fede]|nr:hypothetical protein SEA_FEDE_26 [Microbacterium phage Fede]
MSKHMDEWDLRIEREANERKVRLLTDPERVRQYEAARRDQGWLQNRKRVLAAEEAKLQPLRDHVTQAERDLIQSVAALYSIDPRYVRLGTFWECKYSVTGRCIYDLENDRTADCCVVCHEPMERK